MSDNVNHPSHYQSACGLECIDALRAFLTPEEFRGLCKGQAVEYILRERGKGRDEDVRKAIWWLEEMEEPHETLFSILKIRNDAERRLVR